MECPADEVATLLRQTGFRTHSPARQLKACSNILLNDSVRTRGREPPNPGSQLPICDANDGRLVPADGGAKRRCGRYFDKGNSPSFEQRYDLVQTIRRCVARYNRTLQRVSPRRFTYLFHSDNGSATADAEPQQTKDPSGEIRLAGHAAVFPSPSEAPWSPPPSSVVSSSIRAMMRSASSGAMPARRRKSSRSRSMMSFSVR